MPYLSDADSPAIRAAIDISLDASNLPDAVIGLPQYRNEAERWLLAADPGSATYVEGSDAYDRAHIAAIFACAALCAPVVPMLTSETYPDGYRYTRKDVDSDKLALSLWRRAEDALKPNLDGTQPDRPRGRVVFTKASGYRGR